MPIELPPSFGVETFLAMAETEYEWLVPGLLERGDRLILTGQEGGGKSTFLRQFAWLVHLGIHPFTLERLPEPVKVFYVDLENSTRQVRRKLKELGAGGSEADMEIACWPEGLDLSHADYKLALERRLDQVRPDLLIIGPSYKMAPNLIKEEESAALAFWMDQQRQAFGCAIFMESHQPHWVNNTNDRYRPQRPFGSSLWLRWPEFGICLMDDGVLHHWRGARDERDWPSKLRRGEEWPWEIDQMRCQVCSEPLSGKQEKYCSPKCAETGKKRAQRRRV